MPNEAHLRRQETCPAGRRPSRRQVKRLEAPCYNFKNQFYLEEIPFCMKVNT